MAVSLIFQFGNVQSLLLCFFTFIIVFWYFKKKPTNIPPGPFSWPFAGNFWTLLISIIYGENMHEMVIRLSKKYGKIFSFDLGGNRQVIFLSDAGLIKEAFQKPELSDRNPVTERVDRLMFHGGRGVLQANGDIWRHQRRFSLGVFRSAGVGKRSFDEDIAKEAILLCDTYRKRLGKPFNPRPDLMNATSNMICSIAMGKHFHYEDEEFRQILQLVDTRNKSLGQGALWFRFTIVQLFSLKYFNRFVDLTMQACSYMRDVIKEHKQSMQEGHERGDLIDLYLKEIEQTEDKSIVNENHLVMFVDNLFGAGTETSSNTLSWCILCLIANPGMQHRIRDEIIATCGEDRLPMYSDRSAMPFTEAFILEVHRMYTIVPLGLPHFAGKETTLNGYTIPKGSLVLGNLWAVHHDPLVWDEPEEFRPSRFLDENGKVTIKKEFMPFSIGRRVCLGERLAKMEVFIFLTHLLSRFSFEKVSASTKLSFQGCDGITYGPVPFEVLAKEIK